LTKRSNKREKVGAAARQGAILLVIVSVFMILGAVALINLERPPGASKTAPLSESAPPEAEAPPAPPAVADVEEPAVPEAVTAPAVEPAIEPAIEPPTPAVSGSDFDVLIAKDLLVPVTGVSANKLRDNFNEGRSEGRAHEALDILAAGGTPVVAVADGMVMKLFQSDKGGITLYQADSTGQYVYYYAHLMRYNDGVIEGKPVKRGEVIGFVGDTGNAGAGNYHLHFAIFKPTAPGKWHGGIPINPFPILKNK
jgi:murein DD-endopeptidase MepM/ murein hydrolase activator NlpD